MNSDRSPYGGIVLFGAPSRKQRLARRRLIVTSAIVAMALTSWLIGALAGARDPGVGASSHYFTSE